MNIYRQIKYRIEEITMNHLKLKKHMDMIFAKNQKPYFGGIFGLFSENKIFPENLAVSVFYF